MENPDLIPGLRPPPGIAPAFQHRYPLSAQQIALVAVTLSLCVVGVVAKTYTRARIMRQLDLSDVALILALLSTAAFAGVKLAANTHGQGFHQWDVNLTNLSHILLLANILEILYGVAMFFAKYAVLRQIEVIFYKQRQRKRDSWVIWTLIWTNLLYYLGTTLALVFACVPRAKISNPLLPGRCISTDAVLVSASALNVLSDISILIIPIVSVWRLQLSNKKKFGVSVVFAVGIFACVACIVRLYYSILFSQTDDATWLIEPVGSWAIAEFTTVILVACFPVLPRLLLELRTQGTKPSQYQLSDMPHASNNSKLGGSRTRSEFVAIDDVNNSVTRLT